MDKSDTILEKIYEIQSRQVLQEISIEEILQMLFLHAQAFRKLEEKLVAQGPCTMSSKVFEEIDKILEAHD